MFCCVKVALLVFTFGYFFFYERRRKEKKKLTHLRTKRGQREAGEEGEEVFGHLLVHLYW